MLFLHNSTAPCQWFSQLASLLDARSAPRMARLFLGCLLARGRRTVTRWIRAAGLSDDFRACYTSIAALGKRTDAIASRLAHEVVQPLVSEASRLVFALDDTPTPRYGPHVQGAGVHHNPTPGPAGSAYLYGHNWVVLGLLARHACWGVIALPLLARLYVRKTDLPNIPENDRPKFATKLEFGVELMRWAKTHLAHLGKPLWVVADGAYAKAPFLKPVMKLGIVIVSRLRKDAALHDLPEPPTGGRGRPRQYGRNRIELARLAAQPEGWTTETFELYGKPTTKKYKTFEATWRPVSGVIRVVLVQESHGWVAFFSTDRNASVADILGLVADRFSLENCFRDLKEVVGAGEQQVRRRATNVGAFHVCLWTFVMTEAWSWSKDDAALLGHRGSSPWDVGECLEIVLHHERISSSCSPHDEALHLLTGNSCRLTRQTECLCHFR